jgi:hypothetical protein
MGCSLLAPYPGNEEPGRVLGEGPTGGGSPFDRGTEEEPLLDPATDPTVSVVSNRDVTVANPGYAFPIDLGFTAQNANVVGGGIQFPGSSEIQWTFIEGLEGTASGTIQFGYVVDSSACDDIAKLCHEIETTQFAVARNLVGDVDGDGSQDGEFVVSEGTAVTVVLACATCESDSCKEVLPAGCVACNQPQVCKDYFDRCLAIGQPNANTDEADLFDNFLGVEGVLWATPAGCQQGQALCERAQENADVAPEECGL